MSMMFYGIVNCDIIKKVKKWLIEYNIDFVFYDYRKDGILVVFFIIVESVLGWEVMLNKCGIIYC